MTQTIPPLRAVPRPHPAPITYGGASLHKAPPPPPPTGRRALTPLQRLRADLGDTPGRMRLVAIGLVIVSLIVGLAGMQSFSSASGALERADKNAAQLVRLQSIQTGLVRADADATNAFLLGGLEPVELREDYTTAIENVSEQMTYAAGAQTADGHALAALSAAIETYTSGVVQARAANRLGLPVGAQYLREASAGLRADALALLESLNQANEARAELEFSNARDARSLANGIGLLGLALVAGGLVWLARRTHRYVNLPLAAACVVVLVVLSTCWTVLGAVAATVSDVQNGPYAAARTLAQARIAAFDAKANESLTLISRGSGAAFEESWVTASDTTTGLVSGYSGTEATRLQESWSTYVRRHEAIRQLDNDGSWDNAVAAATARDDASANASFEEFNAASERDLKAQGEATSSALQDAESGLGTRGWMSLLAGVLAAAFAWWGLSQRIEEYR